MNCHTRPAKTPDRDGKVSIILIFCRHNLCMTDLGAPYGRNIYSDRFNKSAEDVDARIDQIRRLGQPQAQGEFNAQEARSIYIRGLGVTSANDARPVLGTSGLGPCVAVALYNPQTRTAALAHFDTNTDPASIHAMMSSVGGGQPVEVHMTGGEDISRRLVRDLVSTIDQYPNATIRTVNMMNNDGLRSIAIDSRTGAISTRFMGSQLDTGPDRQGLMGRHAAEAMTPGPLRVEYMHGEIAGGPKPLAPQR